MRQIGYSLLMGLALVAGGCGGFDNTPFRTGNVRGRLAEADPAVALVSVVGKPDIRSSVNEDGSFVLERVPAGPTELFIVASATKAVRLPVEVPGGGSARVEDVQPRAAGFLELKVRAPEHQGVGKGQVSVLGTPFHGLRLAENGKVQVGPLPEGCYVLETSVPGFPVVQTDTCVRENERKEVKIELPEPDDDFANRGCGVNGCESGSHCAVDGRCVECVSDDQCPPGLVCRSQRCSAPGAQCAPCGEDAQCPSGQSCEMLREGFSVCVAQCNAQLGCVTDGTCLGGWCMPGPALLASCITFLQVGTTCTGDEYCRARGMDRGLCIGGTCTYHCTVDIECPEDFACVDSTQGPLCQLQAVSPTTPGACAPSASGDMASPSRTLAATSCQE